VFGIEFLGTVVRGKQQGFFFKLLRKLQPGEDEMDLSNAQWRDGFDNLVVCFIPNSIVHSRNLLSFFLFFFPIS
jgi:hypothetical protein